MPRIVRFGNVSPRIYTFPDTLQTLNSNFGNLVPITDRTPGMSGGLDQLGDDPAPNEIGNVQITYKLIAATRDQMTAKRDVVNQMLGWGVQRLYMQPTDPLLAVRWCRARINNIGLSQDLAKHSDLWQTVSINWQASDPHWYAASTEAPEWGDSTITWGGGAKWGGSLTPFTASAFGVVATIQTITNNGKLMTRPRIVFVCTATAVNPMLVAHRYVGGSVVDQVQFAYVGTMNVGDQLEINPRAYSVIKTISGVASDAYSSSFDFYHPDWFRLEPGANSIDAAASSGTFSVYVRYYEVYA